MSETIGGDQLLTQQSTFTAQLPPEGPLAIPALLTFSLASQITVDFTYQMQQRRISAVQGVIIRNWNNSQPITVNVQGTRELIDVPAYCDAFLQLQTTNRAKLIFVSSGGVDVPVVFTNVPISPLIIYSPNGGAPVIITGTVTITGTVGLSGGTIDVLPAQLGTIAPSSTTVATGGTPVTVFTAPTVPVRVVNPNTATEPLFLNAIGNAGTVEVGGTFALGPGNGITLPPTTGTITANAVTNGHTFSAWGPAT